MTDSNEFAAVALVISQGTAVSLALMPDLNELRLSNASDVEVKSQLRHAECVAGGLTIAVGAIGSFALKTRLPIVAAVVIVLGLVSAYEITLAVNSNNEMEIAHE